jgi:hypothetical protein
VGEIRNAYRILILNVKERHQLEDLGVDGRKIFKWLLKMGCKPLDRIEVLH